MATSGECFDSSQSEGYVDAVIVHAAADTSKAKGLASELARQGVEVTRSSDGSDSETVLCGGSRGRCVVYLSTEQISDRSTAAVFSFARCRGLDAVVVVLDTYMETVPDDWARFRNLRGTSDVVELCGRLAAVLHEGQAVIRRRQAISGYSAAFRHCYGYLRHVLTNFHVRLKEIFTDHYEQCVKKLLIVCPESCQCPASMTVDRVEGATIESMKTFVLRNMERAGQKDRDFNVTLYRIRDVPNDRYYYFTGVFAVPLGTLSKIHSSGLAGVSQAQLRAERNRYFLYLRQLLESGDETDRFPFRGQYRLLYWRTDSEVALDEFLLPIVREELASGPVEVTEVNVPDSRYIDGPGVNPASLYRDCYKFDRKDPKGICLIINIADFDETSGLIPDSRSGTEEDVEQLVKVFKWLKFKVKVRMNLNKAQFLDTVREFRDTDHSDYDAFVCCIMSHGRLGCVCTADCQTVKIIDDVAAQFYPQNCPTLDGKPKMFFIQACQSTRAERQTSDEGLSSASLALSEGGFSRESSVESDADISDDSGTRKSRVLVPDASDFFMSYSTLPRNLSYRVDDKSGTFYIQELCEVLTKGQDLQISLKEVAERVKRRVAKNPEILSPQIPFYHVSSGSKSVFLCGELSKACIVHSLLAY